MVDCGEWLDISDAGDGACDSIEERRRCGSACGLSRLEKLSGVSSFCVKLVSLVDGFVG